MMRTLFTLAALAYHALAQSTNDATATTSALASAVPGSSSNASSGTATTKTIFLPISNLGNIAASIVTAAPDSTVYGLACLYGSSSTCPDSASVTITEGESTLIYTMGNTNSASPSKGPTTINCALAGGTRASQVVCTGASSVPGLGPLSSLSTLAGGQLNYVPVTVTAGAQRLSNVLTAVSTASASSTSSGSGAMATAARWVVGGVAGVAVLGVM